MALLKSPYNWVVFHPPYQTTNQGPFFRGSCDARTPRRLKFSAFNFQGRIQKRAESIHFQRKLEQSIQKSMLERQNRHCELPGKFPNFIPLSTSKLVTRPILFLPNTPGIFQVGFLVVILLDKFTISRIDNTYCKPCQLEIAVFL